VSSFGGQMPRPLRSGRFRPSGGDAKDRRELQRRHSAGGKGDDANQAGDVKHGRGGAMHYADQWKALSARIRGLSEAAEFDHRLFANNNTGDW
jgi:hypothetical protein